MKKSLHLFGFVTLIGVMMLPRPAPAHDWYTGLRNKGGELCCNIHDFKPVKAWVDDSDGLWHIIYPYEDGRTVELAIPPEMILPDELNKEPFQAHAAVLYGKVRCFFRKSTGG